MQNLPSRSQWAFRHRLPHNAFMKGKKPIPLAERTTKRFAGEFEAALRQRGANAASAAKLHGAA